MNGKQKQFSESKLAVILVIVIVVGGGAFFALRGNSEAVADPATTQGAKSQFSFTGAPGWWQGATNETSMALFEDNDTRSCFVSAEYNAGTVDVTAELKKNRDKLVNDDYVVTPVGTQTLKIATSAGRKEYVLHQSAVTSPQGMSELKGGQEFGYLQLADGYLKIAGYCDTADELSETLPALGALKFNSAN